MTADARRRAEEALATMNGVLLAWGPQPPMSKSAALCHAISVGTVALEALIASEPAPPAGAEVARLTDLLRECNAVCLCGCPESEHESYGEDGESCGHDDHECLRVAPAVLEIVQRYRVALSDALAQKPAGAEVREAAERHRVEADHRCCLDLLRSARLYFADGHPMRLAIERTLAERPAPSSARGAKGGAE